MVKNQDIERVRRAAIRAGWECREQYASTGSVYIECARGLDAVVVRLSTHGECYPPARGVDQFDVSPGGVTVADAVARLRQTPRFAGNIDRAEWERLQRGRKLWERWERLMRAGGQCRSRGQDDAADQLKAEAAWVAAGAVCYRDEIEEV